ncbi:C-C motif chemokine 27a [Triplophysa dalaica]|uniref:C-C motif chemokine 27a n=1 Tax=Triplophysa dalaica TaxID=1582913 RepID=UPI0024DF55CB|nr:C-C motif chemokine 27a [Triplophysa dalaica]
MELKATCALLLLIMCVTIFTSTEGFACCLDVSNKIPPKLLRKVSRYEKQKKSGTCDIDAVVLYIDHRRICAHHRVLKALKKIKREQRRTQKVNAEK